MPSYSVFYDVLTRLDADAFATLLVGWLQAHAGQLPSALALPLTLSLTGHRDATTAAGLGQAARLRPGARPNLGEWLAGAALVLLVSYSRIHLQVHFPSDVLVGILAAALLVLSLRELPVWRRAAS